ncbi:MAG: Na(+)/H(+) antiporter subunit B [Ignisphaera sp.]
MKKHREMIFITLLIVIMLVILIPTLLGGIGPIPHGDIRPLAKAYLNSTFNIYIKDLWTASPEAVAAIVWDYRGLDTFYETIVFYTAIVSCLILYREILGKRDISKGEGLSIVVKRVTAISLLGILVVGASTVLHGMLTPGGGFQGGAIMAVAPVIVIIVFSRLLVDTSRLSYSKVVTFRNLAILGIALTALIPIILGFGNAFIFQNQYKRSTNFSYPTYIFDVPMGGSLWFLNLFEGLAVFMAFYLAFNIILYSEEVSKEVILGEEYGY